MSIDEAQSDVRRLYPGGFYGQLVSALVWLSAAAVATWFSTEVLSPCSSSAGSSSSP
jgi:hypothetical protein